MQRERESNNLSMVARSGYPAKMVEETVIDKAGTPQSYTAAMQSGQLRRNTLTSAFSLKCQAKWTLHFVEKPPQ